MVQILVLKGCVQYTQYDDETLPEEDKYVAWKVLKNSFRAALEHIA
jgi:hypothetical protein